MKGESDRKVSLSQEDFTSHLLNSSHREQTSDLSLVCGEDGTGRREAVTATARPSRVRATADAQAEKVNVKDVETKLEDQLTNEKLQQLHQVFAEADEDGGGGLDMEEFRNAMRPQMSGHMTDDELDRIFMKVDTNCDGTVDWDEYLTYMLLECRGQDTMDVQARQTFPSQFYTVKSSHRDSIIRILFIRQPKPLSDETTQGRYVTVSQEGVLNFWDPAMKLHSTFRVRPPGKSVWVTDTAHIPSLNALVISTTSRDILLFDISANKFAMLCRITNLDSCALCLHYWDVRSDPTSNVAATSNTTTKTADTRSQARAVLLMGDAKGAVAAIVFDIDPNLTVFNPKLDKKMARHRIAFQEILLGKIQGMKGYHWPDTHNDLVRQVMYCQHLGCFISCTKDSNTAMFLGDLDRKITKSYFKVHKGIDTFDYNGESNVIVTGGYDGIVRVWNPYVPAKPVILLYGHKFPVLHVVLNQAREHVVSVSENKEIRVHDLSTQTCIQTFYRKTLRGLGPRKVSAFYLNQRRQGLILATNSLVVLEKGKDDKLLKSDTSHAKAVTNALYNPLFQQVVSVSTDSMVYVWDIHTGQKVMQFRGHVLQLNGIKRNVEITSMTFDPTYRRLITAGRDGTVKIWNFNNGACLRDLETFDTEEVASIACPKHRIITAGWNRRISVYTDRTDDNSVFWLKPNHREDILSLAHYNSSTLASASFDGNILVWSLDTNRLICCLNADQSSKPMRTAVAYLSSGSTGDGVKLDAEKKDAQTNADAAGSIQSDMFLRVTNKETSEMANIAEVDRNDRKDTTVDGPELPKKDSGNSYNADFALQEKAVEKLIFMQSRENDEETATLFASCADGTAQAWSIHHRGGLLGTFPVVHIPGETSAAMTTDPSNNYFLITGDSAGYIKVFDIRNYCVRGSDLRAQDADFHRQTEEVHAQFPFVGWKRILQRGTATNWVKDFCQMESSDRRPPLVNSYRAHTKAVTCVDFAQVSGRKLVLSASSDCSVRLWTLSGIFLGIFGQRERWSLLSDTRQWMKGHITLQTSKMPRSRYRPADIHRAGSPTTLRVLNSNGQSSWRIPRHIVKWLCKLPNIRDDSADQQRDGLQATASLKSSRIESDEKSDEEFESAILGRAYKRTTRHRPLPRLPKPRYSGAENYSVYACLPCPDLQPVTDVVCLDSFSRFNKKCNVGQSGASVKTRTKNIKTFQRVSIIARTANRKMSVPTSVPSDSSSPVTGRGLGSGGSPEARKQAAGRRPHDVPESPARTPETPDEDSARGSQRKNVLIQPTEGASVENSTTGTAPRTDKQNSIKLTPIREM